MRGDVIHIMSDYRSGSTLLDQLLGANPSILGVGELHHLRAYAEEDRSQHDPDYPLRCSCGERILDCPFWSDIQSAIGRPLATLRLSPRLLQPVSGRRGIGSTLRAGIRRVAKRLTASSPGLMADTALGMNRFIRDSYALYDCILDRAEVEYLVDSSKEITRLGLLLAARPERNRVILLCRDYRGVIHSKRQRGKSPEDSARSWANRVHEMEALTKSVLPDRIIRMRYEDLCENPENEMQRLCRFLGVEYSASMTERPAGANHQIGGSPSKLIEGRKKIELDRSYIDAFTPAELARLKEVVGNAATIWGYD